MKSIILLLFPLILSKIELGDIPSFSGASPISFPKINGVVHLTEDTFEEALRVYDNLIIKFYAEWCGHCKVLAPEYAEAAKSERLQKTGLVLAEINVDFYRKISDQFNIKGFPQLLYFKKGKKEKSYNGDRKKDDFINWAIKNLESPYEIIKDVKDISTIFIQNNEKPGLLYYGNKKENLDILQEYSLNNLGRKIGVAKYSKIAKARNVQQDSIQFFSNFGKLKVVDIKNPKISNEVLDDIFYTYGNPQLVEDSRFVSDAVFNNRKPLVIIMTEKKDSTLKKDIEKVANKIIGIKFSLISYEDDYAKRIADYYHIKPTAKEPIIFILSNEKSLLYHKYTEDKYSPSNLENFVKKYLNGEVQPEIKSEEIPEKQDKPVFKLVAKNFEKEVIQSDINYLVKFYRPSCPHCARFAPEFEKAANELKNEKNIRLAEFDVSANDNNFVSINGVPSVFLYANGKKNKPIPYEGNRTAKDIKEFILKNIK